VRTRHGNLLRQLHAELVGKLVDFVLNLFLIFASGSDMVVSRQFAKKVCGVREVRMFPDPAQANIIDGVIEVTKGERNIAVKRHDFAGFSRSQTPDAAKGSLKFSQRTLTSSVCSWRCRRHPHV